MGAYRKLVKKGELVWEEGDSPDEDNPGQGSSEFTEDPSPSTSYPESTNSSLLGIIEWTSSDPSSDSDSLFPFKEGAEYTTSEVMDRLGFGKSHALHLSVLLLAFFSEFSMVQLTPILFTMMVNDLDVDISRENGLNAATDAGFALSYPLWGYFADQHGRKPAVILSGVWAMIWSYMCCASPTAMWLILFRLIFSFAGGVTNITMTYYYEYLPTKFQWVGPLSGNQVGGYVFAGTFPIFIGYLLSFMNNTEDLWRIYLAITSIPLIIFCVLSVFVLEESPRYLVHTGNSEKAFKILEKIAKSNKKELPGSFSLIREPELGSSEEDNSTFWQNVKQAVQNKEILRSMLCIALIGTTTRFINYGMVFIKNEFVFSEGRNYYCSKLSVRKVYLDGEDYLLMLLTVLGEVIAVIVVIPVLKSGVSLKVTAILSYSINFLLTTILFSCPSVTSALFIISLIKVLNQVVNLNMWLRLSGLLPTKVRATLFGVCTFFMYFTLPVLPYLTVDLADYDQHYVTGICLIYITIGLVGAAMLPKKVYQN